jgi:hypothetical protein
VRPTAAQLSSYWTGTPEHQFLQLFNAALDAYTNQYKRGPASLLVPRACNRASASFTGSEALNVIYNSDLSFESKLSRLQSLDRAANEKAAAIKSLATPGKRAAKKEKRNKGAASRRSGNYGKDQYGSNKRSPHIRQAVHASPTPGANFAVQLPTRSAGSPIPASLVPAAP